MCSSQNKIEACKALGSFDGINYKQIPNYSERIKLMTDGKGVEVILDPILGSFFANNLDSLGYDSRWVIYGTMGGVNIEQTNMMKLLGKRASIITSTLRNRSDSYKTQLIKDMERECIPAFESGLLKPIIDSTYDLSNAAEALGHMKNNANIGKIVLKNDL